MLMSGLGLPNQSPENSGQCNGLVHGPTGGSGRQSLQVEWKVMLDWGRGLNRFDFERSTDVGERAGTKGKRFGVVGLPSLVLGAKVKCPRVLKIRGKDNCFISSLSGQLNSKIPRIQSHKGKFQLPVQEVFLGEGVKPVDSIAEAAC
jgi:hypothetical protein